MAAIQAALAIIDAYTEKIDDVAVDGLLGTEDSLAYRVGEVERHLHSYETWLETAAVPNGEIHVADEVGDGAGAFQIDAGNLDWGAWVQVVGSGDTPVRAGSVEYDLHRIAVEDTEHNATYFIQIAFGDSGAAALAAGNYTDLLLSPTGALPSGTPVNTQARRAVAGTKAWARTMCPGQNTGTLDFYIGIHEYEG